MRSPIEHPSQGDFDSHESYKELQVLNQIEEFPEITQRVLSQRIGIALGLTNIVIRRLISKGYIRSQKASWKRWIYALTPEGASHKIRLTVSYIRRFMNHYQNVRSTLRERLAPLAMTKESKVAILGVGEFAELVYLGLKELGIEYVDVFTVTPAQDERFLGMPVRNISEIRTIDYERILVASLNGGPLSELAADVIGERSTLVTLFPDTGVGV